MKSLIGIILLVINLNVYTKDPSHLETENLETFSISGKVIETISGESLAGAEVEVLGTDISVYSNFDGEFEIKGLKPGVDYSIKVSYVSFKNKIIRGVNSSGEEILIKLKYQDLPQKDTSTGKNPVS